MEMRVRMTGDEIVATYAYGGFTACDECGIRQIRLELQEVIRREVFRVTVPNGDGYVICRDWDERCNPWCLTRLCFACWTKKFGDGSVQSLGIKYPIDAIAALPLEFQPPPDFYSDAEWEAWCLRVQNFLTDHENRQIEGLLDDDMFAASAGEANT